MKGIVVKQNGKVCEMQFENTSMEHLAKLCGFNSKNKFKRYHTYHEGNYFYSVFGKTNGRAGSENKYELPPPIDNKLFFHTMFILKSTKPSNTSYIHMKNIQDLSVSDWKKVYENLFGGFEDLGETESSSEDELKHIDKNHLTKQGYLKDDFVIEDEDDEDEDEEEKKEEEEVEEVDELTQLLSGQQEMLLSVINILEKINKKIDVTNELSEIMDDDIKQVLMNINKVKYTIKMEGGIDDIIGDSKIGNLAKEISDSINLDDLNIDNPNDLLDPSKLFNSENGNVLGNLVQQVGTSITDKLSSGEIKQDELISDAFNLMNKMQNGTANNPILSDMFSNMMNNSSSTDADASADASTSDNSPTDFTNMMQNMMNPEIIQNMMSSMGGMQGINQNNPNSREGQMREKLKNKLKEKK